MSDATNTTATENAAPDISTMSFETAVAELERIVDHLERGDVPLDKSIEIYERGEALKAHCEKLLGAAGKAHREDPPRSRGQAHRHRTARPRLSGLTREDRV